MAAPKPAALSHQTRAPSVVDTRLLTTGAAALLLGAAFYMFARADTPLFLHWIGVESSALWSGAHWLPSFLHAAAFTLLSAAFLPPRKLYWAAAAFFWFGTNAGFEWLQTQFLVIADSRWIAEALSSYAATGIFDSADLIAAAAGALTGFGLCWVLAKSYQTTAEI